MNYGGIEIRRATNCAANPFLDCKINHHKHKIHRHNITIHDHLNSFSKAISL